jgi:hypothetical protein
MGMDVLMGLSLHPPRRAGEPSRQRRLPDFQYQYNTSAPQSKKRTQQPI